MQIEKIYSSELYKHYNFIINPTLSDPTTDYYFIIESY